MYEVVQLLLITHGHSLKKYCQCLFYANALNSLNCGPVFRGTFSHICEVIAGHSSGRRMRGGAERSVQGPSAVLVSHVCDVFTIKGSAGLELRWPLCRWREGSLWHTREMQHRL